MASRLDDQLNAIMAEMTAPGAPFELTRVERRGLPMPAFRHAPATLPELFDHYCTRHADLELLVDGELRLTFAQTYALAQRVSAGLIARHGVRRGDRIGIAARNSANWIIAYMGVLMAGGCAALINGWWSAKELTDGILLADCALVLADDDRIERLSGQVADTRIVRIGDGDPEAGLAAILADRADAAPPPELTGEDRATIVFTSGSTGISKGAVSDHFAVVQATMNFAAGSMMAALHFGGPGPRKHQATALLAMPLFHVAGEIAIALQSLIIGRRIVVMAKWDPFEAMTLIERERVTGFLGAPLMTLDMALHPARGRFDLSSCAILGAGGAPPPEKHIALMRRSMPTAQPLLGYGLTETNSVGCFNLAENYLAKPGSTGPATRPLAQIAILGPDHRPLPTGLRGEIAVRSAGNMTEYWRNPIETAAAFTEDGFFLTGDLGYLDEDGYLFVVDRKKDIIIRGGENISCVEVEQAIYQHNAVAEASVFGMPCEHYGEVPVAVVATKAGQPLSDEDLRSHLERHVAAFKVPVQFWTHAAALPRLGSQKIDKRALKACYSPQWEAAKATS
ncbi:MAG TPA: class I adenylate-forming enzyme family protein [Novosphingobium sp.]